MHYFVSTESKNVTPVKKSNQEVLWVKIGKELCGVDVYLGTVYYSPTSKKESISIKFQTLSDEILFFQRKDRVIPQGDFNTGTKEDTISADKFDQDAELREKFTLPARNSEDSSPTNIRGKKCWNFVSTIT